MGTIPIALALGLSLLESGQVATDDCNLNGVPDRLDVIEGVSEDCNGNAVPDECDVVPVPFFGLPRSTPLPSRPSAVAVADIDADGELEAAVSLFATETTPPRLVFYDLAPDGVATPLGEPIETAERYVDLLWADLDGDGLKDVVGLFKNGVVEVRLNLGDTFGTARVFAPPRPLGSARRLFALSGSPGPRTHAVVFAVDMGISFAVAVTYYGDGRGGFRYVRDADLPGTALAQAFDLADVIGSPEPDALVLVPRTTGSSDAALFAFENLGDGFFASEPRRIASLENLGPQGFALLPPVRPGVFLPRLAVAGMNALHIFAGRERTDLGFRLSIPLAPFQARDIDFVRSAGGEGSFYVLGAYRPGSQIGFPAQSGILVFQADRDGHPLWRRFVRFDGYDEAKTAADVNGDGLVDIVALTRQDDAVEVFLNVSEFRSADADRDGVPDECLEPALFHRGDPDSDGTVTVSDAVALLEYLFRAGAPPACLEAGDVDNDGQIVVTDVIRLLHYLFLRGDPPAPPPVPGAGECGPDPDRGQSRSTLSCRNYTAC